MRNAIIWFNNTGAKWRDIPSDLGAWQTVFKYFGRWNTDGTLQEIVHRLTQFAIDKGELDGDLWCIDGTILRAHCCAAVGAKKDPDEPADHALGRSKGGFTTKMHVLTDGKGNPLGFHLTAGQVHESTVVDEVLMTANDLTDSEGQGIAWPIALSGDKGYRADWIDEYLIDLGIMPVIPPKASEDRSKRPVVFDKDRYRSWNIVERLIGWLKESRRIFSRYEKSAKNFSGMIRLGFIQRYYRTLQIGV